MNRRKPETKKKFEGNRGKKKITNEVALSYSIPKCPADLNDTAKVYWKKIAPYLIKTKQLHILSEDTFAELCDLHSRLKDINKMIDLGLQQECQHCKGIMTINGNRSLLQVDDKWDNKNSEETRSFRESALSDIKRKYSKQFLEYSKQFHLTPESMKGFYNFDKEDDKDELI